MMEDYYKVLGVKPTASQLEISTAFRQKALRLHPDRNDADDAHDQFLQLNEAFEVLRHPLRRREYDLLRGTKTSVRKHPKPEKWRESVDKARSRAAKKTQKRERKSADEKNLDDLWVTNLLAELLGALMNALFWLLDG